MEPDTGEICLASALDHEQEAAYDFTVVAVDRVSTYGFLPAVQYSTLRFSSVPTVYLRYRTFQFTLKKDFMAF